VGIYGTEIPIARGDNEYSIPNCI